jgi:Tol biopolymer transport system component
MARSIANGASGDARRLPRIAFLVTLLALTAAASGLAVPTVAAQETPVDVTSPAPTPDIEIAGIREIELEFEPITLSPDGAWIAGLEDRSSICLFSLVDEESRCQAVPLDGSILAESITWSPDSSAIAFSLDALPTLRNSDIFVLDVAGADLVDLTPDPANSGTPEGTAPPAVGGSHVMRPDDARGDEAFWMDLFPAWSPDGTELIFARHSVPDGLLQIMRMPRTGDEVEAIVDLASNEVSFILGPILWLEDDAIIFSGAGSHGGIRETSLATGNTRMILSAEDPDVPDAVAVSVSADREWLSVYSNRNVQRGNVEAFFALVERETGEILIFTFAEGPDQFVNVVPRFGPEGRYIATTMTGNPQSVLIWDIATGRSPAGVSLPGDGPDLDLLLVGLSWAANDTILVPGPDASAHIVEIQLGP